MKKYFLLLAMVFVGLVACEKSVEPGPDTPVDPTKQPELTLTSEAVLNFAAEGGQGTVTYTLTNVEEGVVPSAESGANWVTDITVADNITFNVAVNETTEVRNATLYVEYGEQNFSVQIMQAGAEPEIVPDVIFEATALNGESYGDAYTNGKSYDYYAILSKNGTTGYMDLYIDTYYRFDIYSDTPLSDPLTLPLGEYVFDEYDLSTPGTFGSGYSFRFQTFEDGTYKENRVLDGKIVVTENHIEAIVKYDDGKIHKITYDGSLELSYLKITVEPPFSRLTNDYTFNHSAGVMRMYYFGDAYGVGNANWIVDVMNATDNATMRGDYFRVDLVANGMDFSENSVYGTYTAATKENVAPGNFIAGSLTASTMGFEYLYSWYYIIEEGGYISQNYGAPLSTGTVKIEKDGGNYVMTVDCVDDDGHSIKGTYSCGAIEIYDFSE